MATSRDSTQGTPSSFSPQGFYSPQQAAELMGCSEADVIQSIRAGKLRGIYRSNIENYVIARNDLTYFLKLSNDTNTLKRMATRCVLLVDPESKVQDIVKLELGREGCEVKVATTEHEIARLLDEYRPKVMCVHLASTTEVTDSVGASLKRARRICQTYVIVYHNYTSNSAADLEISSQLTAIQSDLVVPINRSIKPLVDAVRAHFGLTPSGPPTPGEHASL